MEAPHLKERELTSEYESLSRLIAAHINESADALPVAVLERVSCEFGPYSWAALTPTQRLALAQQLDIQQDPGMDAENKYWFDLACEIGEVEQEIASWRMMNDRGVPSEAKQKKDEILALTDKLKTLQCSWAAAPFARDAVQRTEERATMQPSAALVPEAHLMCDIENAGQETVVGGMPIEVQVNGAKLVEDALMPNPMQNLSAADPFAGDTVQTTDEQATLQPLANPVSKPPVRHKLRKNSLDVPIDKAIALAGSLDVNAVWLELRELAMNEEKPFLGTKEGGALCYTNDDDMPAKLSKDALRKRLKLHAPGG